MNSRSLQLKPKDLVGLPDEVLSELSIGRSRMARRRLILLQLFAEAQQSLNLDQLLVNYYRKTGVIAKRANMVSWIYRLQERSLVKRIGPGRYELTQQPIQEAA